MFNTGDAEDRKESRRESNTDDEDEIPELVPRSEAIDSSADNADALYKFRCKVGSNTFEEIMTYNRMLEWCDDDVYKDPNEHPFKLIRAHRKNPDDAKKWQLDLEWIKPDGSTKFAWNDSGTVS